MAFAARFKGMKFVILTSIGLDLFNPTLNRGGGLVGSVGWLVGWEALWLLCYAYCGEFKSNGGLLWRGVPIILEQMPNL